MSLTVDTTFDSEIVGKHFKKHLKSEIKKVERKKNLMLIETRSRH